MAPDTAYDEISTDLATLGRALPRPAPAPHLTDAVMTRLADAAPPAAATTWLRLPGWVRDGLARRRREAAVVVTALLLGLLAAPPVRAAVADWFGFAGVIVRNDPTPARSEAPAPPPAGGTTTLEEATGLVSFDPLVPAVLGPPQGVEVSADGRVLSLSWSGGPDDAVRMDQFDARLDYTFAKSSPSVSFTEVGGRSALWFDQTHRVTLLNRDGTRRFETARLAGHTLIWEQGDTTVRVEGDLTLDRAVEIAESVTVVP
jgi:hypothetical protein